MRGDTRGDWDRELGFVEEPPQPRISAGRIVARVLAALVCAGLLAVAAAAYSVWKVARLDDRRPSDAIIVLGSAQYDGTPSPIFEARLDHALQLYEDGIAPRIITVGGSQPGDRFSEAGAGQQWLADQGVPTDDLVPIEYGGDTLSSMRAAGDLFREEGWSSAVLVTDPWHSLRAQAMADDNGIDAVSSPTRQGPAVQTRETEFRYILRESAAFLYYRLLGTSPESGFSISID